LIIRHGEGVWDVKNMYNCQIGSNLGEKNFAGRRFNIAINVRYRRRKGMTYTTHGYLPCKELEIPIAKCAYVCEIYTKILNL
jgi:hypothetical protein